MFRCRITLLNSQVARRHHALGRGRKILNLKPPYRRKRLFQHSFVPVMSCLHVLREDVTTSPQSIVRPSAYFNVFFKAVYGVKISVCTVYFTYTETERMYHKFYVNKMCTNLSFATVKMRSWRIWRSFKIWRCTELLISKSRTGKEVNCGLELTLLVCTFTKREIGERSSNAWLIYNYWARLSMISRIIQTDRELLLSAEAKLGRF